MKLVIGGAFQGKLTYAKETYHIADGWVDGKNCSFGDLAGCRGVNHFHAYVRRLVLGEEPGLYGQRAGAGKNACADGLPDFPSGQEAAGEPFLKLADLEKEAEAFARELVEMNPELVVVTDELGCGIVPAEKTDRLWREATGRICTALVAQADEVVRVFCGLGIRLK